MSAPLSSATRRRNGWVLDIAVDPLDSSVVYSGADGVRKSVDGGHTWKTVFLPYPTQNRGSVAVPEIAIAPGRPESIYALASQPPLSRTVLSKSTDAGGTWHPILSFPKLTRDMWGSASAVMNPAGRPAVIECPAMTGNDLRRRAHGLWCRRDLRDDRRRTHLERGRAGPADLFARDRSRTPRDDLGRRVRRQQPNASDRASHPQKRGPRPHLGDRALTSPLRRTSVPPPCSYSRARPLHRASRRRVAAFDSPAPVRGILRMRPDRCVRM
jgi:hypothetical protein